MAKHKNSESGQAIFLIAFALVALLGFSSLAIDGGRVYSDRRKAQNTADTSAFAGALVIAQSLTSDPSSLKVSTVNSAINAALLRAASNLYDDADPMVDVEVTVTGPHTDNGIYYLVRVTITSEIETTFAHLVYDGELKNTVYAIAKASPQQGIGFGMAMFGTSLTECKTVWFAGTSHTVITGGGVFSNSSADTDNCASFHKQGSGDVNVIGGTIGAVGSVYINDPGTISPAPVGGGTQKTLPELPLPDCSGLPVFGDVVYKFTGLVTIIPGIYSSITVGSGADVVMNPGMYCITGTKGFDGNGGNLSGNGVLIYLQDGGFQMNGQIIVRLFASQDLIDPSGYQWGGMLLYMDPSNDGYVQINGGSGTKYRGTIYAPSPGKNPTKAKCTINGGSNTVGISSQIICYSLKLTGSANIHIKYNSAQNFKLPASLALQE